MIVQPWESGSHRGGAGRRSAGEHGEVGFSPFSWCDVLLVWLVSAVIGWWQWQERESPLREMLLYPCCFVGRNVGHRGGEQQWTSRWNKHFLINGLKDEFSITWTWEWVAAVVWVIWGKARKSRSRNHQRKWREQWHSTASSQAKGIWGAGQREKTCLEESS